MLIFLLEMKEKSTPHFTPLLSPEHWLRKTCWGVYFASSGFIPCAPFSVGKAQQENPEFSLILTLSCKTA